VRVVLTEFAPVAPEIAVVTWFATGVVATVNVVELDPAGTVAEAGTVAALELLCSVTAIPPMGAVPFKVTVPVGF
jgi:hypothetical protein